MSEHKKQVDEFLAKISTHRAKAAKIKADIDKDIEALREKYSADLADETSRAEAAEKELTTYLKKNRAAVFGTADRVDVKHGAVIRHVKEAVRKAKDVSVELLKKLGYPEGVRVEESVNWDAISQWNDDKLTAIGTERTSKESFSYELTTDKAS